MIRIGIPRGLLYYQYYPMWKTFFERLGAEVVVSPPTTKATLAQGSARVVAETCLPVKVFCGHVLALAGQCDYLFIPGIRSLQDNVYNCSKFLGLPDVVRAVVPEAPPIIDPDIEVGKGKKEFYAAIYRVGRHLTWNPLKVREAALAAWQAHLDYQGLMQREGLTPPQALARLYGEGEAGAPGDGWATIAVIGHPYAVYDGYINHRLIQRLQAMGVRVVTAEMVAPEELAQGVARLAGRPYWTYEDEVVGAGGHYLEGPVDGVVSVVPFGCGPDSLMLDLVQRHARRHAAKPFMSLTIDEHTAEAGLVTRLEAFLDMLRRSKKARA